MWACTNLRDSGRHLWTHCFFTDGLYWAGGLSGVYTGLKGPRDIPIRGCRIAGPSRNVA